MRLTDFHMTKKGRVALYVDGEFCFALHPDVFAASGLSIGDEVDPGALADVQYAGEVKLCKDAALRLLTGRDYTKRQLVEKLARRYDADAAEEAAARMEELGLIHDRDYAMRCARDLVRLKAYSPRRAGQELRRRGVDEELVEEALAQFDEDDPREAIAQVLLRRHAALFDGEEVDERLHRRAVAALQRLGYRYDDIRYVIENIEEFVEET